MFPNFTQFMILGLAVYRTTRLITLDQITAPLREWVWRHFPPECSKLGYLLTCDWCTSFWIGSLYLAAYILNNDVTLVVAAIFALSAVAGIISVWLDK